MADKIVPLTSEPDQNFAITLPIDNKNITLFLRVRYNSEASYWYMTVFDTDKNMLIDSLPLVAGEYPAADLLGQYKYLGLGSATIVKTGTFETDSPNATNLGTEFVLVWGDTR